MIEELSDLPAGVIGFEVSGRTQPGQQGWIPEIEEIRRRRDAAKYANQMLLPVVRLLDGASGESAGCWPRSARRSGPPNGSACRT